MGSLLETYYYSPKNPARFDGIQKLKKSSKESFRTVKNWLTSQDTYTLHKPIRTRFQRRRVMVGGIDDQWQADLVFLLCPSIMTVTSFCWCVLMYCQSLRGLNLSKIKPENQWLVLFFV